MMRHLFSGPTGVRLLATASVLIVAGGPWFASCASKPVVDVSVQDPDTLRPTATWAQLIVFPETCPTKETLEAGVVTPNVKLFSVEADQPFPEVGDLDKGKYGFTVVLRNENCGVLAFGCTPVDLEHHRHVTIILNEHESVDHAKAECSAEEGETCDLGQCVEGEPQEGGTDAPKDQQAEAGATCNFKLVAAANLDNPVDAGAAFAGPNVVATPKGFVIVYREIDSTGTNARAVRQFISDEGEKGSRTNTTVPACAGELASNGIAAAWSASQAAGFMAVSSIPCAPSAPAAYVANFDEDGKTMGELSYDLPDEIKVAGVKGATAYPTSTQYLLAAVSSTSPVLYTFDGVNVNTNIGAIQNGGGAATFAQIAAAPDIVATIADSDASGGRVALSVQPPGSGTIATSFLPLGSFATLTVWDDRVLAAVPDGNNAAWVVVDAAGDSVAEGDVTGGPFDSLDAAALNDHVLLAGGAAAKISLFRFDDTAGTISDGVSFQTTLASPLGGATLANYDGGRVAIAAARNRVIVTWLNSAAPIPNATTAPGGFAVLTCDN